MTPTDSPPIDRKPFETPMADVMGGDARWEIKVHDHGLVALTDVMPRLAPVGKTADYAIVQAARVSYGEGTRQVNEDRGLIRYLARHRHSTPFEMVEFKFHHVMPIFIARQWIRHRTACLAGDSVLSFDLPGAARRAPNRRQHFGMTIERLHELWHRVPMRERVSRMRLRMCDESTGEIRHTQVTDVWQSGVKPVFKVTLENSYALTMTADHRCLTDQGWLTLSQATQVRLQGEGQVTWNGSGPALATNGLPAHRDPAWLQDRKTPFNDRCRANVRAARSGPRSDFWNGVSPLVRQWTRIVKIEYAGEQMTYDLSVAGPFHNFVANGFIVHNSVNEYSARYSVVRDRFYHPAVDNIRKQSATNRQGGEEPIDALTAQQFLEHLDKVEADYKTYEQLMEKGVSRELARIALPVSVYTEWYWKCDLHNIFHFLSLRMDPHAQQEIRDYANAMYALIRPIVPIAAEAFVDYQLGGMHLTRLEIEAMRTGQPLASENKRENAEWEQKKAMLTAQSNG
jgi:flavin-dependent thymidylate synthase